MEENAEEGFQYHIEVQEGVEGADGEVIIIYNYDGAELTPELLAKTLEELSTQTSLQRSALNRGQYAQQGGAVVCLPSQDELNISAQLDPEMLSAPVIKIEDQESLLSVDIQGPSHISTDSVNLSSNNDDRVNNDKKPDLQILNKTGMNMKEQSFVESIAVEVDLEKVKVENIVKDITGKKDAVDNGSVESYSKPINQQSVPLIKVEDLNDVLSDNEDKEYTCNQCSFNCKKEIELQRHNKLEHKEKDPFICRHCSKAFHLELSLSIHKLGHLKYNSSLDPRIDPGFIRKVMKFFSCPLCDFQYQKKVQLTHHMKNVHPDEEYHRCSKCNFSCLTEDELTSHLSSPAHEEESRTLCPLCGTATKDIRQHIRRTHNDNRPFLCTQCGFKAKTFTHLNTHMVIHDPVKRIQCDICDYKCRTKDQLKKHLVKHSTEKEFKCNLCHFACKTSMSLKRHMQIHKTPNKYVCYICEFTTHDKLILRRHKAQEHILKASYKCRECDSHFERIVELKKHALAEHKSEKTEFCSYCDFTGQTLEELRIHMQSHFGKFPFKCDVCGYMCRLKASYHRHIERHNKVKKFKCTLCTYASVEKYDLQKHYAHRHSDDKPLACPYCSYRCKFKPRLNNHISYVHSDIKPFFCKLCPYTGKSAENLKKHMVNHGVVIKSLQCVLCDYATAEKAKLKRHMQVHVKKAIFQCA
ncbi:unnamed protein product [Lymnaea stagnalis]|uniref:C2H2-type domain-containing protein n=1 Tax=Lymnaea stagnalis TaxID=6523 RepID=A0AAV2IBW8_LYMST